MALQARIAMRMPWWTLGSGFETVRSLAKLEGDHAAVTYALSEANMTASGPLPPGITLGKEPDLVRCILPPFWPFFA